MLYAIQLILYCLLFSAMVKFAVRGGAIEGLYFYPKPVRERAYALGLAERRDISRKRRRFMILFFAVMLVALLLIIGLWDGAGDFRRAYPLALMFLEVMNWYDGIVIDKIWVGLSGFWRLHGCEDIPYVQTWAQILKKRLILTLIWIPGAAVAAGLAALIF